MCFLHASNYFLVDGNSFVRSSDGPSENMQHASSYAQYLNGVECSKLDSTMKLMRTSVIHVKVLSDSDLEGDESKTQLVTSINK